jgi:hypothetical protein
LAIQKQGLIVRSYLLYSSLTGVQVCCTGLNKLSKTLYKMLGQNHFAELEGHVLTFLCLILIWRVTY